MIATEIDRILQEEPPIEASSRLSVRVMQSVRQEVSDREAIQFPWRWLVPGLVASAAIVLGAIVVGSPEVPARPATAVSAFVPAISLAVAGSLVLAWWSARLVNRA